METIFISDDQVQLVLIPNTELDRLFLSKLSDIGPVEIELVRQPIGILGKSVKDAVIIRSKPVNNADKTEEL